MISAQYIHSVMDRSSGYNRLYSYRMSENSQEMLAMDYISISLALVGSLLLWWSFLAISGLKRSKLCEKIHFRIYQK